MPTAATNDALPVSFERLLEFLHRDRGFDFTGYKRTGLARRIDTRVHAVEVDSYDAYLDYLQVHPEELALLFNAILINVTTFFRDPDAWKALAESVLPKLLESRGPDTTIRVWSAGCASGEEPYTIAMVLAECMGERELLKRVKIYATDVDDEALAQARAGTYTAKQTASVPPALVKKYFEHTAEGFAFRRDLRRTVIFGRHDLIQDAPISRIDLLVCRNTIMYFNAETQTKILHRLHFALNDGGVMFLGKAEMLLTHADLFAPIDSKRRIFGRVRKPNAREQLIAMAIPASAPSAPAPANAAVLTRLRDKAFDASPVAQLGFDAAGTMLFANERAREMFTLGPRDIGRRIQDLEVSYRPVELRSCIEQAHAEKRTISQQEVRRATPTGEAFVDLLVMPLMDSKGAALGTAVTFTDVTQQQRLARDLEHTHAEFTTAYEQLQSTSEELETTNEELQSTVEELETTNEELHSTNEELETMNEELQSTNEELQTTNDELRKSGEQLENANDFLESILTSLRAAVAVLDRDLIVRLWNRSAEELWGLRADEVTGQNFFNLDIGLPVAKLREPMRACLARGERVEQLTVPATNRRGRKITCDIACTPLGKRDKPRGVIVFIESTGARSTKSA